MKGITQKELAFRWGVSSKTVTRRRQMFNLGPADYTGNVPVFDTADVKRMEKRLARHRRRIEAARRKGKAKA